MGRGCPARAAAWATVTHLGMRAVGVRAVGIIHGVIGGTTTIVQSRPTRAPKGISHASGLWRGRVSERLINTERRRDVPAIERESTRERERDRDTLTCNNKRDINML